MGTTVEWIKGGETSDNGFGLMLFLSMGYESTLFAKCISNSKKEHKAKFRSAWCSSKSSAPYY